MERNSHLFDLPGMAGMQLPISPKDLLAAALQLSYYSYDDPGIIAADVSDHVMAPSGYAWRVSWGPAVYEGNLAFVAALTAVSGPSVDLILIPVVRGTDITGFNGTAFWDLYKDAMPWVQTTPSWLSTQGAAIASGTDSGFGHIVSMRDPSTGKFLLSYLQAACQAQTVPFVFVAGHSLGGCLASVLAPYFASQIDALSGFLGLITFAAPTAGNELFTQAVTASCGWAPIRFYNTLDIIPLAWADFSIIVDAFGGAPFPIDFALDAINLAVDASWEAGYTYAQTARPFPLEGKCYGLSWSDEALAQHRIAEYWCLFLGTTPPKTNDPTAHPQQRLLRPAGVVSKCWGNAADTATSD